MKSLHARGVRENCLPTFSIKFRYFGTSLIKIGRLEFQLTKHSSPMIQSRALEGRANTVSGVMARIIPIKTSSYTRFQRLSGATH